jgi:hypothetical protein
MKKLIVNCILVLLLAGLAMSSSSFKTKKHQSNFKKETTSKISLPFTGRFTITFGDNGSITAVGEASHWGRFSFISNDDETGFPFITGTQVYTVANGDQIFVTHTGYATDLGNNTIEADFDNTITGGTGKFTGATGHFETVAIVNELLPTAKGTISGNINY